MKKSNVLKICAVTFLVLTWNVFFIFPETVRAEESSDSLISLVSVDIQQPLCGTYVTPGYPQNNGPLLYLNNEETVMLDEPPVWIRISDYLSSGNRNLYSGPIIGGNEYLAFVTITAKDGFHFDETTKLEAYNHNYGEGTGSEILQIDETKLTCLVVTRAIHDWDPDRFQHADPTCISEGYDYRVCAADPSHTETIVLPIDPEAHEWGEWKVVTEPSKRADGIKKRVCERCEGEEVQIIPRIMMPFTKVYEPDTSWAMSATVAWRSDQSVIETAASEVRPATAFVWPDSDLNIYDRNGNLISDSIDAYIASTQEGMIPAFYIRDAATSSALKMWLEESGLVDCFVVSDSAHKYLVKDVADLTFVRGMLDYSSVDHLEPSDITEMVASVNEAHGKVIILSQEAADRDTVHKLQSLAATVWVRSKDDIRSLMTLYTSGVNGVLVDDYKAAFDAEEFFQDDAPTLLRIPQIFGHRGDPSVYVENTLDSARGAYKEGADAVENDIQLSADGRLFIFHDETPNRLLALNERDEQNNLYPAEHYTLEELQAYPLVWEKIIEYNEVRPKSSRDGTLYGQNAQKPYYVPTFDDYLNEFKDTKLIHDTEIKSSNPDIIPVFKELVDKYDAWDQVFFITFNARILNAIYNSYPEISIGMLCNPSTDSPLTGMEGRHTYQEVTEEKGAETALMTLYSVIDKWNATYNPSHNQYGYEMARAGRHRGLTVWTWTYLEPTALSRDYLRGVNGMTVNNSWILSDHIKEIQAEDITVNSVYEVEKPKGVTRTGEVKELPEAELIKIERISNNENLMIWRYKASMNLNGENYGEYYLYSAPFVLTTGSPVSAGGSIADRIQALIDIVSITAMIGLSSFNAGQKIHGENMYY